MLGSFDLIYALIMLLAISSGGYLLSRSQSDLRLNNEQRWGIAIGAFGGSMIFAKLPFLFGDWQALALGTVWFANGKTILFGLVGGYLGVEVGKWLTGVRTRTGDSFAVPVAVAVAIGRVACFRGGCCYGTPTDLPWGIVFSHVDQTPRHPTQLYEATFHATAALLLWGIQRTPSLYRWVEGQLIKIYFLAYLSYRFFTEIIRPEARIWYGLTGYQYACLVLMALFAWLWIRDTRPTLATSSD